jgi:hypothetical protein
MWQVWETEEMHTGVWWGELRERDDLEVLGVGGRTLLKWICKKWVVCVDWIDLAEDRDRWRALVSVVMNLRVP